MPLSDEVNQKLFPAEYFNTFISRGLRPDGRKLDETRQVSVHTQIVSTARASSSVRIGSSYAIAGVNLELSTPQHDIPDEGFADVKVRLPCSRTTCALPQHRARSPKFVEPLAAL
jgi:exosome complex RNA-binding protein Rrp42 (RNase PH superfamily)